MNTLDFRRAMQLLHPTMRFGHDYLGSIHLGAVQFKVWKSPEPQPTLGELIAALSNHAPSLEERVSVLEVHAQQPIPNPQRPEWWQTSEMKFHPDVTGKPERIP